MKKVVFVQEDGITVPMPVLYERLPDFCFYCAHIGHQFRECLKYRGQPKEELPYGSWMTATTQVEKGKHNRSRERFSHDKRKSKAEVT